MQPVGVTVNWSSAKQSQPGGVRATPGGASQRQRPFGHGPLLNVADNRLRALVAEPAPKREEIIGRFGRHRRGQRPATPVQRRQMRLAAYGNQFAPFDEAGAGNGLTWAPRQSSTLRMTIRSQA